MQGQAYNAVLADLNMYAFELPQCQNGKGYFIVILF